MSCNAINIMPKMCMSMCVYTILEDGDNAMTFYLFQYLHHHKGCCVALAFLECTESIGEEKTACKNESSVFACMQSPSIWF